mmetsp:Transcript_6118/g.6849  ORF Transcript_6118/g.6849 Transcript_6118/m.6849 type:complete len:207 (+) Transcript_6118:405-1025(+)
MAATPSQSFKLGKSMLLVLYATIIICGSIYYWAGPDRKETPSEIKILSLFLLIMGYLYLGIPVAGVLIILCCLPCIYLSAWYRHRNDPDRPQPASKSAIKKLKKLLYEPEKNTVFTEHNNTCSICLEDYEPKDKLIQLKCFHYFHRSCAEGWFKYNGLCPTCRTPINPKKEEEEQRERATTSNSNQIRGNYGQNSDIESAGDPNES